MRFVPTSMFDAEMRHANALLDALDSYQHQIERVFLYGESAGGPDRAASDATQAFVKLRATRICNSILSTDTIGPGHMRNYKGPERKRSGKHKPDRWA